jgi:hypothetical protein
MSDLSEELTVIMERFNLKKLVDTEVKEQYQVKISNKFADLENFDDDDDDVDISRAWESFRQMIKASATDSVCHQYKPWFQEECSKY